jgi:transposase
MKRGIKLVKNIELLLKQLNCRSFLHHFGPKKYKLKDHLIALLLMQAYKLSLRRVESLLNMFGIKVPTYSALCKRRKKIPSIIWYRLMLLTAGLKHKNVAIDGTGFSKTNPSHHYIKRIDREEPVKNFAKLSMLYDVDSHKAIAFHVRDRRSHDMKDAKPLLRRFCRMQCLLADKAYDAEWLHQYCFERNVQTIIPKKINIRRGRFRKKQMKNFTEEKYHQRSNIESGFSAIKRKYGGFVYSKSLASIKSEIYCKGICHNLRLRRY